MNPYRQTNLLNPILVVLDHGAYSLAAQQVFLPSFQGNSTMIPMRSLPDGVTLANGVP